VAIAVLYNAITPRSDRSSSIHFALDRAMPIPIGTQLRGQIEYGISLGLLRPGDRLPSVRELATAKGIAQATVSHAYSVLKREGLIQMRPGMGTFVAAVSDGVRPSGDLADLHRIVDAMAAQALACGFTPAQISHAVTARLAGGYAPRPRVALVGLFGHATEVYVRELAALLADLSPEIVPYTLERLRAGGDDERSRICAADLVLTIANRVTEVQGLLPPVHPPVHGLTFIAHPATMQRLRALPRDLLLGVVSTFGEFLPTMLQGILACVTPSRAPLCAVLSNVRQVRRVLAHADAVVYASGSEAILEILHRGKQAIEYLHTPEPSSVRAVRPLLEGLAGTGNRSDLKGGAVLPDGLGPVGDNAARQIAAP
jgi:DNA-binding transcriptional regulator YhcF (GntR family)